VRVLIDACVLFPTVLRELVIGVAETGAFEPMWSTRILEEWWQVAARYGVGDLHVAEAEIARLAARFPEALAEVTPDTLARVQLPDRGDDHVLAAAVDGGAGELLTLNVRDFPTNVLAGFGVNRRHPDEFLVEAFHADPGGVGALVGQVLARAGAHGVDVSSPRKVLKRARVPRFARAVAG